jgi:transposase
LGQWRLANSVRGGRKQAGWVHVVFSAALSGHRYSIEKGCGTAESGLETRLKQYSRTATRYEKTAINFLGFVACLRMWLA